MKLEPRYIVLRLKDIAAAGVTADEIAAFNVVCDKVSAWRTGAGKGLLEGLVVEKDWPEYQPTLAALSDRVDGKEPAKRQGKPETGSDTADTWRNRYMETAGKLDAAVEGLQLANVAFGAALDRLGGKMTATRADLQRIEGYVVVGGASANSYTFELKAAESVPAGLRTQ